MIILKFESGTLILDGADKKDTVPKAFVWDERTKHFRAPAYKYREIITEFVRQQNRIRRRSKKLCGF